MKIIIKDIVIPKISPFMPNKLPMPKSIPDSNPSNNVVLIWFHIIMFLFDVFKNVMYYCLVTFKYMNKNKSFMGAPQIFIDKAYLIKYYSKPEIQNAIFEAAQNREIGVQYANGGYGKRPDILQYPSDVLELVKQGVVAFNFSEEKWGDPLEIQSGMQRKELDKLRIGWDLILDIDSDFLEYAIIAADLIIRALQYYNVPVTIKFSGRAGFHIAVPWEAFPETVEGVETRLLFPEAPKKIAMYLENMIEKPLGDELLKKETIDELQKKTQIPMAKLVVNGKFKVFEILHIDTVLISSRHLFRAVYSINQKSGLVSIPLDIKNVLKFDKELAKPENITIDYINSHKYLNKDVIKFSAKDLFVTAFDYSSKKMHDKDIEKDFNENGKIEKLDYEEIKEAIPEKLFPPCIKLILNGQINDGRKRSVFILINFLKSVGWSQQMIEMRFKEWNKVLKNPLREQDYIGQLRYSKDKEIILPPNCDNKAYYIDIGVCKPDSLCSKIKNPVSYASRKMWVRKMVGRTDTNLKKEKS